MGNDNVILGGPPPKLTIWNFKRLCPGGDVLLVCDRDWDIKFGVNTATIDTIENINASVVFTSIHGNSVAYNTPIDGGGAAHFLDCFHEFLGTELPTLATLDQAL